MDLQKRIQTVTILIVGLSVLSILLFTGLHRHSKISAAKPWDYDSVVTVSPGHQEEIGEGITAEPLGALAAEKLVSDALGSSLGDLSLRFRLETRLSTFVAHDILKAIRTEEGEITELKWLGIRYIGEKVIEEVSTKSSKGQLTFVRLAQITCQPNGSRKVDFCSYVRKVSHPWNDIVNDKVEMCIVRVIISKSTYHNGVFKDDTKWRAYKLSSPDTDTNLYVYAELGSEEEIRIRDILATDEKSPRVTLEIRRDGSLLPRQFQISKVIAQDWIRDDFIH